MSRPAGSLFKVFSSGGARPLYGSQYVAERRQVLQRHPDALRDLMRLTDLPMHVLDANRIVMRFVPFPARYAQNYQGLMSVPPDIDQGDGVGGYSRNNRFTGVQPDGSLGLNGSYWGMPSGMAAEDFYYSCLKGWDGTGPKRLLASTTPLAVQWGHGLLGYGVDSEMPSQLIFSGNCCTDIVVARLIRKITSVNLNLGDPSVISALDSAQSQPRWRSLLDTLKYHSIAEGIADPDFPDFARALANAAARRSNPDAVWAQSARVDAASGLEGFDPSDASNLVLVGDGRATLSDRIVGLGVVEIRSDANGVHASVAPLHGSGARYDDGVQRSLVPVPSKGSATANKAPQGDSVTS